MASVAPGYSTLSIIGSNDNFAIVYTSSLPTLPAGLAGLVPGGGAGQVFNITDGNTSGLIAGSGQNFVVQYVVPPGTADAGHNTVFVQGDNNAFLVTYEPSFVTAGGNAVSVQGNDSRFVIAYNQPPSGNAVTIQGDGNRFVVANNLPQPGVAGPAPAAAAAAVFTPGSVGNLGVIVGTAGSDTVRVDGSNNLYVIQYGAPSALPEPASAGLLGGAMLVAGLLRRRSVARSRRPG